MEYWDLLDQNRQSLNRTHLRGTTMVKGEYHIVVDIWTVNNKKEILLTLRDPHKEEYPNCWENTCGSVLSGETSLMGAIRELKEETGIISVPSDLIYLDCARGVFGFHDTYLVRKNPLISQLTMQAGETVAAKWVDIQALENMIKLGEIASPVVDRFNQIKLKLCEILNSTK